MSSSEYFNESLWYLTECHSEKIKLHILLTDWFYFTSSIHPCHAYRLSIPAISPSPSPIHPSIHHSSYSLSIHLSVTLTHSPISPLPSIMSPTHPSIASHHLPCHIPFTPPIFLCSWFVVVVGGIIWGTWKSLMSTGVFQTNHYNSVRKMLWEG